MDALRELFLLMKLWDRPLGRISMLDRSGQGKGVTRFATPFVWRGDRFEESFDAGEGSEGRGVCQDWLVKLLIELTCIILLTKILIPRTIFRVRIGRIFLLICK